MGEFNEISSGNRFSDKEGLTAKTSEGDKKEISEESLAQLSDLALPRSPEENRRKQEFMAEKSKVYKKRAQEIKEENPDGYRKDPSYMRNQYKRLMASELSKNGEIDIKFAIEYLKGLYDEIDVKAFKEAYDMMRDYLETGGKEVLQGKDRRQKREEDTTTSNIRF